MRITAICFIVLLACSCCHTNVDTHPGGTQEAMTRHDEIRRIMRNHWIHQYETGDFYWWSSEVRKKNLSELRKMKKNYFYESRDPNMPSIPGPGWAIRGPLTIEKIEQESFERIRISSSPDVPQVPFGYENDKWNKLKSQYKDGDEFYFFSLDPRSSPSYYGSSGYVLIRDNQIIGLIG